MSDGDRPYRILGWHLKLAREQLSESVAEVSGAVEIDSEFLELIEQGKSRPSEDVLMLLISHLGMEDAEANSLWELAGYVNNAKEDIDDSDLQVNLDNKILYTDLVHVTVNDFGVVMNFLQAGSAGSQTFSVSRVGMSKDQAKHMLKILHQTLEQPKTLKAKTLPPKNQPSKDNQATN